jgi:hypothetical protein
LEGLVKKPLVAAAVALSLLATPAPAFAAGASARSKRVKVAFMEIRALGMAANLVELLFEVALTEIGAMDRIEAIGRSDIESILGFEKQKKVLGCSDEASCLAEIGGALGVEYIIVGSLGRVGALYRLDMKLVETARGRVRSRTGESVEGQEEKLVVAVQKAIRRLLDPVVAEMTVAPPVAAVAPAGAASSSAKPSTSSGLTVASPAAALVPVTPRSSDSSESSPISTRTWAYTAGGAGAIAVLGGVVFGLGAKSAFDDEKAAAAIGDAAAFKASRDKAKSNALLADVFYGVGAAGLGVGAWLYFSSPSSATPVAVSIAPAPSGGLFVVSGGF